MASGAGGLADGGTATEPFWWPRAAPPAVAPPGSIPERADVVVIGAGVTGLSAALELAKEGASVIALDAGMAGRGGSTRAAGVIGRSLKKGFSQLMAERGPERAVRIYSEVGEAFAGMLDFIAANAIECGLRHCGRFLAANSTALYEAIARDLQNKHRYLGDEYEIVPRSRQHEEIGSDVYHGGAVIPDHKTLDPYLFHAALRRLAEVQGARIFDNTQCTQVSRESGAFRVSTRFGSLTARHLVVATNGYTSPAFGWFRRRLVPLDAYMIATEPLSDETIAGILPRKRTFNDYRIDTEYGIVAPDGKSFIFGGLTGRGIRDLAGASQMLREKMVRVFPQLASARVACVWTGNCAASFDLFPHLGVRDGIHYAMGYSFGSGLPLGLMFGRKIARRILGKPGAQSVFDGAEFPTVPLYRGNPWFLPWLMAYYRWRDRSGF